MYLPLIVGSPRAGGAATHKILALVAGRVEHVVGNADTDFEPVRVAFDEFQLPPQQDGALAHANHAEFVGILSSRPTMP